MAPAVSDPRMMSIRPRVRYNTIGGVNGPLVILENVFPPDLPSSSSAKLIQSAQQVKFPKFNEIVTLTLP